MNFRTNSSYSSLAPRVLFVAALLASPTQVLAAGLSFESFLLGTSEGMYLKNEAPALRGFFQRISLGSSTATREEMFEQARLRLQQAEFAAERAAIEERFNQIHDRFQREMKPGSESELTREQKIWLNQAANHLRINPDWAPSIEGGERVEFFAPSPVETFEGSRAAFMKQAPDLALTDDPAKIPVSERPAARKRIELDLAEMRDCVTRRPPSEKASFNYKYLLTQLVTDEVMTAGGAVIAAGGVDGVDWKTLPNDLAFEAFASMGDSLIATMPGKQNAKFDIRWYVMQGFGVVQSSADAVLYSITRSKDSKVSTGKRFAYHSAWNAGYSKLSIGLYDLIAGMECVKVHPAIILGTQVGAGLGLNVAYFGLRNVTLGKNSD